MVEIDPRTQIFLSLAETPGNSGTRLFNRLFRHYGINALYKACRVTPQHLADALKGFRALEIAGGGISRPFKRTAAVLVDELDPIAESVGAINTVFRVPGGQLKGWNTDYTAAQRAASPDRNEKTVVLGSGGSASAVCQALADLGARDVTVVSRVAPATAFAGRWSFKAAGTAEAAELGGVTQLFHCTPCGMDEFPVAEPPIPAHWWASLRRLVDLPITRSPTALIRQAQTRRIPCVSGERFALWQAIAQFAIYTGIAVEESLASSLAQG
jgi:shikimate dehydrogenase